MTEKLNLLATDVHDEHIARHLDSNSQNPGSKALPGIAGEQGLSINKNTELSGL